MGSVYYSGNVIDGQAATNHSVNIRTKQAFQSLNPDIEGGEGIDHQNIKDAELSNKKFGGGLLTVQSITMQEIVLNTQLGGIFRFYTRLMPTSVSGPIDVGALPSVSYEFNEITGTSTVTDFTNPPDLDDVGMIFTFYGTEEDITKLESNSNVVALRGPLILRNVAPTASGAAGGAQPPFHYSGLFVRWESGAGPGRNIWLEVGSSV